MPAPTVNGGGDRPRKVQFLELQNPHDLDFDPGSGHTKYHRASLIDLYIHKISLKSKNFADRRTDVRTYWWTDISPFGVIRSTWRSRPKKPRKGADGHRASMHGFLRPGLPAITITIIEKFRSPMTLTLDQVKVISTYTTRVDYQHAQPSDCSLMHCQNMAIGILWNMNILRSLNSRDSFPRRKFENRAQTSCRSGAILSLPTISFELHAKMESAFFTTSEALWPWP